MKKNIKKILTVSCIASFALTVALGVGVFAIPKAEADFSDFTMDAGAGVRMDNPTGIRFTANVGAKTKASLENATDVTFGMLIAPTLGSDGKLTLDDVSDTSVKAKNLVTAVWSDGSTDWTAQTAVGYNGAIVGGEAVDFPVDKYTTALNAVGYVTYTVDDVTTTAYTKSTASRSLAQAVANALANGVVDTNGFLADVLDEANVTIEVTETLNMLVGRTETLVATTSPANCGVIWSSDNDSIVTVDKKGVVTAIAKGETTVTATLGNQVATTTITVNEYVERGGSELVWGTHKNLTSTYAQTTDQVSGRTGVYKYAPIDAGWNDKLMVYESGHSLGGVNVSSFPFPDPASAYENLTNKGYNYITIDVCFQAGSILRACGPKSLTEANQQNTYKVGSTPSASGIMNHEFIKLYDESGKEVTTAVQAGVWYTLWFNHKDTAYKTNQWSAINVSGKGVIYFDKVRYYSINPFATTTE